MTIKTLRLPDNLVAAVHDVGVTEHLEESTALRKLLHLDYEFYLAEQHRAGRLSLRDMARWLGLPLGDALDALQRLGISGNFSAADTLQSLASLAAR